MRDLELIDTPALLHRPSYRRLCVALRTAVFAPPFILPSLHPHPRYLATQLHPSLTSPGLLSDLLQDDGVPIRDRKGLELRLDAEADYEVVCARGACIHSTLMLTAIP